MFRGITTRASSYRCFNFIFYILHAAVYNVCTFWCLVHFLTSGRCLSNAIHHEMLVPKNVFSIFPLCFSSYDFSLPFNSLYLYLQFVLLKGWFGKMCHLDTNPSVLSLFFFSFYCRLSFHVSIAYLVIVMWTITE